MCLGGAGVTVIDGRLFAVGGHDGPMVKRSVEVYDSELDEWRPIADMSLCRRNAGQSVLFPSRAVDGGGVSLCALFRKIVLSHLL